MQARLSATILGLSLMAAVGTVSAQSAQYNSSAYPVDRGHAGTQSGYDYARVIRVDPVYGGYRSQPVSGQRCYTSRETVAGNGYYGDDGYYGDAYNDGYDRYRRDGYYGNGGYYGNDGYRGGTQGGRTMATVIGGIVGAAVGSQMGGGSARYATSAIGSMVGGIAGQQVYENTVRQRQQRQRVATVQVCDPVPTDGGYYGTSGSGVTAYDVTYEYAGRTYTTRMNHHPGDRVRVRVDVAE